MNFSPKQKEALALLREGKFRRINVFEGSVRSGKTYISMVIWGLWVSASPKNSAYLMSGKTLGTLKRNVLDPMKELFGNHFTYSLSKKEGSLCGRKIYLESAVNSASEGKLRGMTLMGAYCDELTLFPEDFFTMLLSRLSEKGAKLFATTNPDSPAHWVKKNFLDNKRLDLLSLKFILEDNIFLPPEYIKQLKAEYTGVYYDRYILGEWTAAEGRIYESFSSKNIISASELSEKLSEKPLFVSAIGVDYGGSESASAFVHVGFDANFDNVYVLAEYYDKKNRSAENLINAFKEFTLEQKKKRPTLVRAFCDSAEQLLVKSFREAARIEVKNALKKPINTRVNILTRLISSGRFFVLDECPHTIEAIETAVWDPREIHKDVRLDDGTTNIDSLDALEYVIERYENRLFKF